MTVAVGAKCVGARMAAGRVRAASSLNVTTDISLRLTDTDGSGAWAFAVLMFLLAQT